MAKVELLKEMGKDRALELLRQMWAIRMFEDQVYDLLGRNLIKGASHLYAGQEAVAVGVCAALNNKGSFDQVDLVYSSHRPTGHAIAKGVDMKKMAAENDFRATGLNGGYGGEMPVSYTTLTLPTIYSA